MNTSYKKILNKSKLILSDFNTDNFSQSYLIKMLINNNISGLLPTELNMVNSNPVMSYDITSKHSVMSVLENKKVDYPLFSSIMQGLHRLCYTLNNFMLDSCYLLLSPEYIFLDGEMQQAYFCYCPVCENNNTYSLSMQLRLFLEYIISKINYDDRDCVAHVYSLHQKCIEDNLCVDDLIYTNEISEKAPDNNFKEASAGILTDNINALSDSASFDNETQGNSYNDIFINDSSHFNICGFPSGIFFIIALLGIISLFTIILGAYMYFIKNAVSSALAIFICMCGPAIFLLFLPSALRKRKEKEKPFSSKDVSPDLKSPSVHIMPIGETVLINSNATLSVPHLVYNGNDFSEDIELTIFPFTIGKLSDSANYIMDNALISRLHARFYFKEESYYVEDLNSSNGTYVNNNPLSPHTMTEIYDGDYITFSHLTYIFKLC